MCYCGRIDVKEEEKKKMKFGKDGNHDESLDWFCEHCGE
jgi:hypothetical protein